MRQVRSHLMICDKVYRFRAEPSRVLPEYLEIVLNSPIIMSHIEDLKTGTSESGMNLTQAKFRQIRVPLPSLDQQKEITKRVNQMLEIAGQIARNVERTEKQLERSSQAILAKAFRGELGGLVKDTRLLSLLPFRPDHEHGDAK